MNHFYHICQHKSALTLAAPPIGFELAEVPA